MGINQFRERVKVYQYTESAPDNIGGVTVDRIEVGEFWCRVEILNGNRVDQDRTIVTTNPVQFTLRTSSASITTKNIIRYNDADYTISSVVVDELKRFTVCQAVSR